MKYTGTIVESCRQQAHHAKVSLAQFSFFGSPIQLLKTVQIAQLLVVLFTSVIPSFAMANNQPPKAVGSIRPVTVTVGGSTSAVDLSGNFIDPDGDVLTYSAQSSDTTVATVSVVNSTIIISPQGEGVTTIIVMVQDSAGLTITRNVTVITNPPPNRAPVVVERFTPLTVTAGAGAMIVDLAVHFSDPDNDRLSYSAVSTDTRVAQVDISGSTLTINPVAKGTTTIMIMAQDTAGLTINRNVTVTVNTPPNRAPKAKGTIAPITLTAGASARTVDMASHFSDPDNDKLTYSVVSTDTRVAQADISGSTLTVRPKAKGATRVMIMVQDAKGLTINRNVTITVNAQPNRAPKVTKPLDPITLTAGASAATVEMAAHFTDPDNDVLSYSAVSTDTRVAQADISGSTLTVRPIAEGTTTVMIMAQDKARLTITSNVTVTVNRPPNHAPVAVGTIAPFTLTAGASAASVDMAVHFSDPNDDPLTYGAVSANVSVATVAVADSTVTVTPIAAGSTTVMIMAHDPEGLTITSTVSVTVNAAPNAAPIFTSTPLFAVIEDNPIVGTVTATDSDSKDSITQYTLIGGADMAQFDIDAASGELRFKTAPDFEAPHATAGTNQYIILVQVQSGSDNRALTAEQSIIVTVTDKNDAPVAVGTIEPVTLTVGEDNQFIDVSTKFSDPDGDPLTYSAQSADVAVATVAVDDATITLTAVDTGRTQVTVTAFDLAGLTATQPIAVTVDVVVKQAPAIGFLKLDATLSAVVDGTALMQLSPDWAVTNGDRLKLSVNVGATGLAVTADISALDTTQSLISLTSDRNGVYSAELRISENNTALNGIKHILVTATDVKGNSTQLIVTSTLDNRYVTELLPNYPNPFNPETWIPYRLGKDAEVVMTIYDARGDMVKRFNLGYQAAGTYDTPARAVYWDGTNDFGETVSTGVYFYTLSTNDYSQTRKATILK